jgi:O-antigen/teichoic acid export membrane protein
VPERAGEPASLAALLRRLGSQAAVYGAADVFTSVVSFALLPLFTRLLTPADYGALGILQLVSSVTKVLFRLGLDGAFLRLHFDRHDEDARRRLAGTALLFSAAVGALLLALLALVAPFVNSLLFHNARPPVLWLLLVAADTYVGVFSFVPQALLRAEERASAFALYSVGRHALNIGLKLWLLLQGFGVTGVLLSDLAATTAFSLALLPLLRGRARPAFDRAQLRELLSFGLPRVPHGLLLQAQNLIDRPMLEAAGALSQVGLYHVGYTLGGTVKFALSAFEPAWQPFVFAQVRRPEAAGLLARVVSVVATAFVAMGLAVALLARELVQVMTAPAYHAAAAVVPVVALAYVLHGAFLLTSIGIAVAKQARWYPLITLASATTNVVCNLLLIPRFGLMGAAWATVAAYAVMAAAGFVVARRLYPLPLEHGRLARVIAAAALIYAASLTAPAALVPALAVKSGLLLAYPVLLALVGAIRPEELREVRSALAGGRGRPRAA